MLLEAVVTTMGMMERGVPYKVAPTCPQQDQYVEIPQGEHDASHNSPPLPAPAPPPSGGGVVVGIGVGVGGGGGIGGSDSRTSLTSSTGGGGGGGHMTPSSLNASSADVCRICHCESEPGAPLISPCICSGSLKYVHQACLQQWIKSADTKSCELCKYHFQMTTKIKPFRKWQKLEMSTVERRKIMCSVTFHIIAITCVIWSLYVLIDRTTEEIKAGILEWPFWTKLIVVAIGFTGGLVFMYVQCKMYVHLCRRWRAYNRVIFIQNCPEGRPPSSQTLAHKMTAVTMTTQRAEDKNSGDPNQNGGVQETELL